MISIICLWWVGCQLSAPGWYFMILAIGVICKFLSYGINMFEKGREFR